jgi:hypothetical protein
MRKRALHLEPNAAAGGWKFFRPVKIEGSNHFPDVLPKLFPRVTFGHECLGETLSGIAAVGFRDIKGGAPKR